MEFSNLVSRTSGEFVPLRGEFDEFMDTLFTPAGMIILVCCAAFTIFFVTLLANMNNAAEARKPLETKNGKLIEIVDDGTSGNSLAVACRFYIFECEDGQRVRVKRARSNPVNLVVGDTCTFTHNGELLRDVSNINIKE